MFTLTDRSSRISLSLQIDILVENAQEWGWRSSDHVIGHRIPSHNLSCHVYDGSVWPAVLFSNRWHGQLTGNFFYTHTTFIYALWNTLYRLRFNHPFSLYLQMFVSLRFGASRMIETSSTRPLAGCEFSGQGAALFTHVQTDNTQTLYSVSWQGKGRLMSDICVITYSSSGKLRDIFSLKCSKTVLSPRESVVWNGLKETSGFEKRHVKTLCLISFKVPLNTLLIAALM